MPLRNLKQSVGNALRAAGDLRRPRSLGPFGGRSQSSSDTVMVAPPTHTLAPYKRAQTSVRSNRNTEECEPQSTSAAVKVAKPSKRGPLLMRKPAMKIKTGGRVAPRPYDASQDPSATVEAYMARGVHYG